MRPIAACRIHALPKRGLSTEEYEDAAAGPEPSASGVRVAVTDGATESAYAGHWARTLAKAAVQGSLDRGIEAARARFEAASATSPTSWYAEAKREEGAFATVLAVEVGRDGAWMAQAVGDCVLLHMRQGALLRAWPLEDPLAFSNRPDLVSSRPDGPQPEVVATSGSWQPGDRLVLCTDAVGAYLLGTDPASVCDLDTEAFLRFVARAQENGMRNDDVTLIDIRLGAR
jgi:hypothetical protein